MSDKNRSLSDEVLAIVHAFPPGDNRRDAIRGLAARVAALEAPPAPEPIPCECGHFDADHDVIGRWPNVRCGGGSSESCDCRRFSASIPEDDE